MKGRCLARPGFAWWQPDACLADGLGVQLADPSHVHFEDDDAQKVAILARLPLSDRWR
jgi:hypothetical protein